MLNIFKNKYKNINNIKASNKLVAKKENKISNTNNKHFFPTTKEWSDSIYAYNKHYIKSLPSTNTAIIKLIKSYFNSYKKENFANETDLTLDRMHLKSKRLSSNRIFVSKVELKHTNLKVTINLYTYNEEKRYLLNKIKDSEIDMFLANKEKSYINNTILLKSRVLNIAENIEQKKILLFGSAHVETQYINSKSNLYGKEIQLYNDIKKNLIVKNLYKEILLISYLQSMYYNKSKFEFSSLLILNKLISKILSKKVEFNIVNLRYLYMNSDVLAESLALKLKDRKNKLLKTLTNCLFMVKLPIIRKYDNNYGISNAYNDLNSSEDTLQNLVSKVVNYSNNEIENTQKIESMVLNAIPYKSVSGVRLEVSGRLSKRFTADRSVFKFKYTGGLRDIRSCYNSLSTVVLRGHVKSNTQFTKIGSKTRNGSFGIKGWISSN